MKIKKQILIILITIYTFISILLYTNPILATNSTNSSQQTSNSGTNTPKTSTNQSTTSTQNLTLASEGAILIDSKTGKILYGKNENQKLYPASTTKILTAILAIEHCKPTDKITASYDAVMSIPAGYSNAAIQPGETIAFQDLLDMFLIHSANEIGNIFAEHISGSVEDFSTLMNKKAAQLGCKNTHFKNPSGIHDTEHYSTAYDMALIARYCMKNETFRKTVSKLTCTVEPTDKYEKRFFRNTNQLIDPSSDYYYEYAIGAKTGYTSQAKRCLIAASSKDNLELITVVLGAQSSTPDTRYLDTINLFEYGYSNYKIQKIANKNSIIKEIVVENATKETENLSLLLKNDITGLVPTNWTDSNPSVKLNESISAPIAEGDILGKITYNIDGIEYSSDLIASHAVEEFNLKLTIAQIALALFLLFILSKLLLPKKKSKKRKSKKKKSGTKKNKNSKNYYDSIYKFN